MFTNIRALKYIGLPDKAIKCKFCSIVFWFFVNLIDRPVLIRVGSKQKVTKKYKKMHMEGA